MAGVSFRFMNATKRYTVHIAGCPVPEPRADQLQTRTNPNPNHHPLSAIFVLLPEQPVNSPAQSLKRWPGRAKF